MKNLVIIGLLVVSFFYAGKITAQSEATFYTSMGVIKIDLTDTLTPITVDSFMARVAEGFYDGLIFHRVIDGFMIQGGDPNGDGSGGPGYTIPEEFHPTLKNLPATLAMAKQTPPHTTGCQFFINLVNNSHLNNKHTVFGTVTSGFPVVQAIGKVSVDANDKPDTNVTIDSIRITRFPATVSNISKGIIAPVYPNPCHGLFNIDLPPIPTKVEIINMQGQVVYKTEAKGVLKIDLRSQPTGLYIVRSGNMNGTAKSKVVVQ